MTRLTVLVALSIVVGSLAALPASAQDLVVPPDVRFMPMDQALEALRRAGFTRIEESTSQLCPAVIDDRIIEIGQVCQQSLPPGQPNRRATLIRLTVQRADPRKGLVGTPREWRLLPKTEGMIEQDALAALHEAGFTDRQRIIIMYVSDSNCPPGRVCRMDPSGHSRLSVTSSLRLVIGK